MTTSPNEWNILDWDVSFQTNELILWHCIFYLFDLSYWGNVESSYVGFTFFSLFFRTYNYDHYPLIANPFSSFLSMWNRQVWPKLLWNLWKPLRERERFITNIKNWEPHILNTTLHQLTVITWLENVFELCDNGWQPTVKVIWTWENNVNCATRITVDQCRQSNCCRWFS